MVALCEISFDRGIRSNGNPVISKICQVKCPPELVEATGVRRLDEANTLYKCSNDLDPAVGSVTKTMDCGAWVSHHSYLHTYIHILKSCTSLLYFVGVQ